MSRNLDVLKLLSASAAMIGNLPESPGYNGSILIIDDEEARRIESDISHSRGAVADLMEASNALVDSVNSVIADGLISQVALERLILQPAIGALERCGRAP